MAREPMSLKGMEDIPDPAASLAARRPRIEAEPSSAPAVPSPTRPQAERRRAVAATASLLWIAGAVTSLGLRADLPNPAVAMPLALWGVLAAAGLLIALKPRERGLPSGIRTVQAISVVLLTGFALSALASSDLRRAAPEGATIPCVIAGGQIALLPLALAALTLRRAFLTSPAWRGALVGAACGLLGAFGIHAHCPYTAVAHVLIAHGAPVLAGAVLGAAAGAVGGRV